MTPKQKAFADYYIQTGNASEAARRAGYSEKTAYSLGERALRNVEVSKYIAERMANQDKARVASADEVLQFYTSVIRGEVKDQFGIDASLADRIKAADSLMKRYNAADEKNRSTLERLDAVLRGLHDAVDR